MGERNVLAISLALFFALAAFVAAFFYFRHVPDESASDLRKVSSVAFNQHFIDGLYTKIPSGDAGAIFDYVFSSLPDSVTVYPTENYYYFSLTAEGKTLWGNLRLDVLDRDRGVIHLGYFEYDENGEIQDREGRQKAYSKKDGVEVRRLERFLYAVTHKGRSVRFRLNDIGTAPPKKAKLADFETFLGNIFDESGLKFFLIFNRPEEHFLYVLNEDGAVPETFQSVTADVVRGQRTGFAFYVDAPNTRKILVGVYGENTDRNNFYDGPFDQLPDNYAVQANLKRYLEEAYPYAKGSIDAYGNFVSRPEARIVVNPYTVYYRVEDLSFVASCKASNLSPAAFYACITPDFVQRTFGSKE
ncbi:MAG: hypothetical protein ACT4OG_07705 [Alphaproteobacteria bacterium]